MSAELRNQIRANLSTKDTWELLDIWKTNDRTEWSNLAFEVLGEILKERLDVLPEQDDPILEQDEESDEKLEEWEIKILDNKDQPELYDTLEVINTIDNINKVAKISVVAYALIGLLSSYTFEALFAGAISFSSMDEVIRLPLNLFTAVSSIALNIAFVYFPLRALTYILRILMEMEFNSRNSSH